MIGVNGMKQMKAVIFDFNGVLWWDAHLQNKAWKAYSATLRGWPLSDEEMDVHVHGRNNRYTLEYLLGQPVTGKRLFQLSEEKETVYRRLCLAEGPRFALSPGAASFLNFLAGRQIPRTIATASAKPNVDFFVEQLGLEKWFDARQIIYDDGHKAGKPAPDFYLQAAAVLSQQPHDCVVIEDSRSGIAAAAAAGIGMIIALGPEPNRRQLRELPAVDRVITSFHEMPRDILNRRPVSTKDAAALDSSDAT
jgi:beta-phosphoglucomutase-like phosphatase (HAD superfamily)